MIPRGCYSARIASLAFFLSTASPLAIAGSPETRAVSAHVSPHSMRIGEPASLEIVVVTLPDRRVLPFVAPQDLRSIEIEMAESLPVEKHESRWIHATRVRFRPRETGNLVWPRTELAIEASDGTFESRILEPVPFEVTSILHLHPGRSEPFGLRPAPPRRVEASSRAFVARGAFTAAAALAILVLFQRRVARRSRGGPETSNEKPWTLALNDLGNAADVADPTAAASTTAAALRRYMEQRFGASTLTQTAEELADATPPFGAMSRWPEFTALLLELDTVRFSPRSSDRSPSLKAGRISGLLDRSRRFVEASTPPEALR